jgi:glycosyltransferase involved in cell wall biosynthesis
MTGRVRVAVVSRSVFPLHGVGGLERHVFDLVRYLADAGMAVTLITQKPTLPPLAIDSTLYTAPDARPDALKSRPYVAPIHPDIALKYVPYRTFPYAGRRWTTVIDRSTAYPIFGLQAGRVAAELVERGRVDIVHGLGASVLGYARRRRRLSAPLVLNPQGLEEFGATDPSRARLKRLAYWPLRRAVLACARAADAVIATDRVLEPAVRQHLHVPPGRVRVIPNALDLAAIDRIAAAVDGAACRTAAGVSLDHDVLLSVGRLEENKGFHILAAALGALRQHSGRVAEGRWRWVIAGEGPFKPIIQHAIAEAGIAANVSFAGRVSERELHAWYSTATLFVHPTLYEGSSLVTLEAMAHRLPVVATAAGGLPDKVKPGVNGWLVPPGDAGALASAISGALASRERLRTFGQAGREIVEREFSWQAAGAATLTLYHDLLAGRAEAR